MKGSLVEYSEDGLNKGITLAEGEIISILHSDDVFFDDNILTEIINK